jgi:squalene-hopene/tetraprenyl-beta-curcumene cyclase
MVARGRAWLRQAQGADGGWGAASGVAPSLEETALSVAALATRPGSDEVVRGCRWLVDRIVDGRPLKAAPIGLYFASLWYSERLYPLVFALGALRRVAAADGG